MTLIAHPPDAAADDSEAERWVRLESEAASLRADNAALREQLTLRDQALDATPAFFVIAKQMAPEPMKERARRDRAAAGAETGIGGPAGRRHGIPRTTRFASRSLN
jgi:hypothetical protein